MSTNIQDLIATLDNVGTTAANEQLIGASRLDLVAALRRNLYRLQTPFERAWDMTLAEPHMYAAVKTGMDLGLWKAWGKAGGESKSIDELVTLCDQECNPNLLRKTLPLDTTLYCDSISGLLIMYCRSSDEANGCPQRRCGDGSGQLQDNAFFRCAEGGQHT